MLRSVLAATVLTIGASVWAVPAAQAQGLVPCAPEHGFCRVPYPTRVIYGVPGRNTEMFVRGRGVPCSNEVFGDPAPGFVKRCAYVERRYGGGYGGDRGWDRGWDRDRYRDGYGGPGRWEGPRGRERPYYEGE